MSACILARKLTLDVPVFLQHERGSSGWAGMLFGAAFDSPERRLARLLEDIDLDIREGDRLAVLGRNGAGKSTLLRVLNRVYHPTRGSLQITGSCQALLNMSLGFNGEATVRENIFLRGVAMGLRSSFLRGQVEAILEFSGLREKSGHRLRTLSTGQRMRLGFAISTSVQHDIMLMDEWVGAGDADFMAKAKERMQSRVGGSKIVVLASHSIGLLRDLCNKGVVLERGRTVFSGDIASSLKYYHALVAGFRAGEEARVETGGAGLRQVYGAVEDIRATEAGRFMIKGWMVDTEGRAPSGLALDWRGHRHAAERIERMRRPDVMRHFGLHEDACGFQAEVAIPGAATLADLGGDIRILGGESAWDADAQLRMSADVAASLRAAS